MLNKETTYSQAKANLAHLLDQVYDERQVVVIKRHNNKNVDLIAEDEQNRLSERTFFSKYVGLSFF